MHARDRASPRTQLSDRLAALQRQIEETPSDREPVALDQTSVGRLSRMDAMQVQAMAVAAAR